MEKKLDFGAMPSKPGPDYCFHSCLYNSTQFWQDPSTHTRVLAFMNLLGCECHADWMNSGHKSQTSTMTLFIQTWLPECRLTLCVINFHRPRTSTSTKLRPRRKKKKTHWEELGCRDLSFLAAFHSVTASCAHWLTRTVNAFKVFLFNVFKPLFSVMQLPYENETREWGWRAEICF